MREGGDGGTERSNKSSFIPSPETTRTNNETNKDKDNHLTINQHHYHMGTENNRNDSNAQQRPVIIITWEQRTIEVTPTRSNAQSSLSHGNREQ
jgi:hypothetical protein